MGAAGTLVLKSDATGGLFANSTGAVFNGAGSGCSCCGTGPGTGEPNCFNNYPTELVIDGNFPSNNVNNWQNIAYGVIKPAGANWAAFKATLHVYPYLGPLGPGNHDLGFFRLLAGTVVASSRVQAHSTFHQIPPGGLNNRVVIQNSVSGEMVNYLPEWYLQTGNFEIEIIRNTMTPTSTYTIISTFTDGANTFTTTGVTPPQAITAFCSTSIQFDATRNSPRNWELEARFYY